MTRFIMALAAACAFAVPLTAQTQAAAPSAAPAAARITVPFNPPLDQPVRYRATMTREQRGQTISVWMDYEFRFSRREGGFRMAVRLADGGSSAMPAAYRDELRRMLITMTPPYVLLLNPRGLIEQLEDADAYWERMLQIIRTGIPGAESLGPAAMGMAADMMRDTSAEGRLNLLTRNYGPLNELSGMELTVGETLRGEEPVEGMMGISVNQQTSMHVDRIENGHVFVTSRGSVPGEDMRRAVLEVIGRMPVTGQGSNTQVERDRLLAQIRAARFERTYEGSYEVALDSGLPRRASLRQLTAGTIGEQQIRQGETLQLERLD